MVSGTIVLALLCRCLLVRGLWRRELRFNCCVEECGIKDHSVEGGGGCYR